MVRILLPPAESPQTTGSSAAADDVVARRMRPLSKGLNRPIRDVEE
jgi:hypothetical protein